MPFESRVLRFIESSLNTPSSDFANKFIQQESSNPRVPLFKEEPTSPPKPSHITAKIRSAAAVKTEPCDRTERKYGGLVGEKIKEEKLEMTDMDTGMEGKKIEFCHQIIKGKVYTRRAGN